MPIKLGVIGVGSFGALHIETYQTFPDVEVVAVADQNEQRLKEVAGRYRIPHRYTDYRELCRRPDIDAVSVVTYESEHRDPTVTALQAGKHVFLEKPMATNWEDAAAILDAQARSQRFLMLGHILRFENRYATVKRLIQEGALGKVVAIHARRNRSQGLYKTYGNRVHLLLETSIHDVDTCLWYAEDRVTRVRAYTRNVQGGRYPDLNWGMLEFAGGAVATLETHWILPDRCGVATDDTMQVIGTKAIANIDFTPSGLSLWTPEGTDTINTAYDAFLPHGIRGAIRDELDYFLDCLRQNRPPKAITPQEAAEALKVTLALIESAEQGREVRME